ncbi:MAG TPA: hypothetical protein VMA72_02400 [Streptosporangiaceae bacterium]|nr:hypothetical protein [Streptosporangiaceae bacterium]
MGARVTWSYRYDEVSSSGACIMKINIETIVMAGLGRSRGLSTGW